MRKKYWNTTQIDKTKAEYRILLGERGNGKSYAVKKKVLEKACNSDSEFIYMRRYGEDLKTIFIDRYFADMNIKEISKGKFTGIYVYRGEIFLCNFTEDNKPIDKKLVGHACPLNEDERLKSQQFPLVEDIIYEEFITNKFYLFDEPNRLLNFVSTVARDRIISVWMVGNKMSRVCPYFEEWELRGIPRQKMGTIETYKLISKDPDGNEKITHVAVENCDTIGSKSTMFFGRSAAAIQNGQWETTMQPKFPGPIENYTMLYELLLSDSGFSFVLQLYVENKTGGMFTYVYPYTRTRNIKRKVTNVFSPDPLTTSRLSDTIRAEIIIRTNIRENKVCFSDNLTGTDFFQVLANRKGAL